MPAVRQRHERGDPGAAGGKIGNDVGVDHVHVEDLNHIAKAVIAAKLDHQAELHVGVDVSIEIVPHPLLGHRSCRTPR